MFVLFEYYTFPEQRRSDRLLQGESIERLARGRVGARGASFGQGRRQPKIVTIGKRREKRAELIDP